MKAQIAIQHLLRTNFVELQSKNHRYSLRSYASKVGVHVGALSSIMNGKRNVSRELAERIARRLLVDPQIRTELLELFPEKKKVSAKEEEKVADNFSPRYLELEASKFKMIAEWEHYAILSLMKTKEFSDDAAWIAHRLGISEPRVNEVIDRLLEVGLVKRDQQYKLVRTHAQVRTSDDTANLSLRKSHEVSMELALESLSRDEIHRRDFASVTMAIDLKNISVAKEMIRKFQDELSLVLESGECTEVYRFSTQLFPLTENDTQNKKIKNLQ